MANDSVRDRLTNPHPTMLDAGLRSRANVERKPLAEEWRQHVGHLVDRALTLARLTKQEISFAMGYKDQSAISRWIAGVERPLLDKLFSAREGIGDRFYDAWVIACAEGNPRIEVTTAITVRQVA